MLGVLCSAEGLRGHLVVAPVLAQGQSSSENRQAACSQCTYFCTCVGPEQDGEGREGLPGGTQSLSSPGAGAVVGAGDAWLAWAAGPAAMSHLGSPPPYPSLSWPGTHQPLSSTLVALLCPWPPLPDSRQCESVCLSVVKYTRHKLCHSNHL